MNSSDAELIEAILIAFVGLLPGGSTAQQLTRPLLRRMLKAGLEGSMEARLRQHAADIAGDLIAAETVGHVNRGSGHSARIDFMAILSRARLTPALLIGLGMDRDRLIRHLEIVGTAEFAEASPGRAGILRDALTKLTDAALEIAPTLPAVQLEFMRVMLRGRTD